MRPDARSPRRALRQRTGWRAAVAALVACAAVACAPPATLPVAGTSAPIAPAHARAPTGATGSDADAWRYLLERGVVQGDPDGRLRPEAALPRAELAVMLARALNASPAPGGCFVDVPVGAWFSGPMCALAARGVLRGDGSGRVHPLDPVRVDEGLLLLRRALDPPPAGSPDEATASAALRWSERRGLRSLVPAPADAPLTRAEGVRLLARLLRSVAAPAPTPPAATVRGTAGCIAAAPGVGATLELSLAGTVRRVRIVAPVAGDGPRALLVGFHGRTNPAARFAAYSDLAGAFPDAWLAFPEALPVAGGFRWSDPGDPPNALRDYALFDALVAELGRRVCLDPARTYLAGHSLGASFAASLACARGDRIRAALLVAGGIGGGDCRAPVAALVVHNPDDRLVPVAEGERTRDRLAAINAVAPPGTPWSAGALAALRCERWGSAASLHPVGWCPHDRDLTRSGRYYPHQWPDEVAAAFHAFAAELEPPQ